MPIFGWYKVTKNIYEATTTKIRLPEAQNLVLNSFSCPHKDATLTV